MFYHKDANQFFLEHGNKYPALGNNSFMIEGRKYSNGIVSLGAKKCYFGVCVWNGMLRFENMEALRYITEQLERETEYFDEIPEPEEDESDFVTDEPALEQFEYSLGFQSLRRMLEIQEYQWLENGGDPSDASDSFIDDDVLLTFLNPAYEMMIGNSVFIFWNEDILIEILNADPGTLQSARMRNKKIFFQANVIVHNIGEDADDQQAMFTNGFNSNQGNPMPVDIPPQKASGCDDFDVDFTFSVDNFNQLLFRFNDASKAHGLCILASYEWEIYDTDNTTVIERKTGVKDFQYQFLSSGVYHVCLKIIAVCGTHKCLKTKCRAVGPQVFNPLECCKRRQAKKGEVKSLNGKRMIKWKASFRNIFIWHSIISSTKHYKHTSKGWKKSKAKFVFAGFKGAYYERIGQNNCGKRVPEKVPTLPEDKQPILQEPVNWIGNTNKKRMRTILRVWDFPNIYMKEKSMMYQHESRDGGGNNDIVHKIELAICD